MNVIFGSGVVGLLAKLILGPDWKVIPFKKSRFFSWNPSLDDNFIIRDEEIDPFIKDVTKTIGNLPVFLYKRAWSVGGHLTNNFDSGLCDDWLHKIFGTNIPPHASAYMKNRMNLSVYDIRVNQMYFTLVNTFMDELKNESSKGDISEIGKHYFIRNGVKEDFDQAISTIPLNVLCKLMNIEVDLPTKSTHYIHLETDQLDFEGYNQVFVTDPIIDFWKVTNIAPNRYLVYFNRDVVDYGIYLMNFMKKFEILDGTMVADSIPVGPMPKLTNIEEEAGIYSVGSYAQWDWCADVGSNILRLMRYANRGNKPQVMRVV